MTPSRQLGRCCPSGNRQDAREGGESPPLPRNCERACLRTRPLSHGRKPASRPLQRDCDTTTADVLRRVFGKVAGESASQETGPRAKTACVPRGTGEPSCFYLKSSDRKSTRLNSSHLGI